MKRFVILVMMAVISLGAWAQTRQGQSALGVNIGYGFDSKNALLGLDYRYNITNDLRINPSVTHFVKHKSLSAWAIDLNLHYVVRLSDMFGFYPLGGVSFSFWNWDFGDGASSINSNRFGANLGLGAELYATREITVGLEVKYHILKDYDQPMLAVRVGYNF